MQKSDILASQEGFSVFRTNEGAFIPIQETIDFLESLRKYPVDFKLNFNDALDYIQREFLKEVEKGVPND